MKILVTITTIATLVGCAPKKERIELSNRWIKLTEKEGQQTVFSPCDAANNEILLLNNRQELQIVWGNEDEILPIVAINETNDGYEIVVTNNDQEMTVTAEILDPALRTIQWEWSFGNQTHKFLMTDETGAVNFQTVIQPCTDCWPEEDCALLNKKIELNSALIMGIWQNSPAMASGWSDTYQFFSNGDFIFNYNQMICDKRTINFAGTWSLSDDNQLVLEVTSETVVEGGNLVPATGACASAYEIEGGSLKHLDTAETLTVSLSDWSIDNENNERYMLVFGSNRFWKMNEDPSAY